MSRRGTVIQMPVHRVTFRCTPLCIIVLVRRIARSETGNRRTRERSIVIPARKVIAGARCGDKGHIRIQHRIARNRIRIHRRVSRRGSVIQAVLHRIAFRRTPLCIKVLRRRIHRREAANRRARERGIVIPTEEGISVSERREHIDGAAVVREHRVAREIRSRIARGVPRRGAVIQMVANRIRNRRCIPLRIEIFIRRICRAYRRNRASRKTGVIVPAEEGIAGPRRRSKRCVRIQHRIAGQRIRIVCEMSRRCTVIQVIAHGIAVCTAPLRIEDEVVHIRGTARVDSGNHSCESGIRIPAQEGIASSRRIRKIDVRAGHIEAAGVCRRIACPLPGAVIHMVSNAVLQRRAPLRINTSRIAIALLRLNDRRCGCREPCVAIPTEEVVAGSGRRGERVICSLHRIGSEARIRIHRDCARRIVELVGKRVIFRRPLCIVVPILRRNRARNKLRDRRSAERGILIPAPEGIARPGHGRKRHIRVAHAIRSRRIRVHRLCRSARTRIHIGRILNCIVLRRPVGRECNHPVVCFRQILRRRTVPVCLSVGSCPARKVKTVDAEEIREIHIHTAHYRAIRHRTARRAARRGVCGKFNGIAMRISGHGSRQVGNDIGAEGSATVRAVVKTRRVRGGHRKGGIFHCRRTVVKIHMDGTDTVIADQAARDKRIRERPVKRIARRHTAILHLNREFPRDFSVSGIADVAVGALNLKLTRGIRQIDGAVVHNIRARGNGNGIAVRIDADTRRNITGQRRIAEQGERRISVLTGPLHRVI